MSSLSVLTHPIDKNILGQFGVGICDTTEGIHGLSTVEFLYHLFPALIFRRKNGLEWHS